MHTANFFWSCYWRDTLAIGVLFTMLLKSLSQIQPESLAVSHQRWCIEDAHRCGSTVWLYRTAQNVWHSSVLLLCVWLAPMCFWRYLAVGKALWLSRRELNWEGFTKWLLGLETCTVYTLVHIWPEWIGRGSLSDYWVWKPVLYTHHLCTHECQNEFGSLFTTQ